MGIISRKIAEIDPDVVCYTEVLRSVLPEGFTIESNADFGYSNTGQKRKVILWSKYPWVHFDEVGDSDLPPGRFVSGIVGGIRFVGVCIPWRDAHVKTGRKDRKPWQDHLSYCAGLGNILKRYSRSNEPQCILGDFNQRIPRVSQPEYVSKALLSAFPEGFRIATEGMEDADGKRLIDHFAISPSLTANIEKVLPRFAPDGTRLSDHVGVMARLRIG